MTNQGLKTDVTFTLFRAVDGPPLLVEVLLRLGAGRVVARCTGSESHRVFSAPWEEGRTEDTEPFLPDQGGGRVPDTHLLGRWQESDLAGDFGLSAEAETWRE